MLKTIKLYGILAKKFGKEFHLAVDNTCEAMRALSVQVPGFERVLDLESNLDLQRYLKA